MSQERIVNIAFMVAGLLMWFNVQGHYNRRNPFWTELKQVLTAVLVAALLDGFFQYALKAQFSRLWLGLNWVTVGTLIVVSRLAIKESLMRLEVLSRPPGGAERKPPLLFVHGAYVGAWCWEEHFLDWFAARGHPVPDAVLRRDVRAPYEPSEEVQVAVERTESLQRPERMDRGRLSILLLHRRL